MPRGISTQVLGGFKTGMDRQTKRGGKDGAQRLYTLENAYLNERGDAVPRPGLQHVANVANSAGLYGWQGQLHVFHGEADFVDPGNPLVAAHWVRYPYVVQPLVLSGVYGGAYTTVAYSSDLSITGGSGGYSNARVVAGSLPSGLALSLVENNLRLSGVPTVAATNVFTVAVDSLDGQTATSAQSVVTTSGVSDPYWPTVIALLHFDGANGSATYTDETGQAWLPVGTSPLLTTADFKFGPASLSLIGTGWLRTNSISDPKWSFGTGDLTIEAWIKPTLTSDSGIISRRTGGTNGWALEARATGAVWFRANVGGVFSDTSVASVTGVLTAGVWQHVALCRNGNVWTIYVNGVSVGTATLSGGLTIDAAANTAIGASTSGGGESPFNGLIDEVRVNNGHCYYTAPFTPLPLPFPNHI